MKYGRAGLLGALFLGAALAGCVGSSKTDDLSKTARSPEAPTTLVNSTVMPDNRTGNISGFRETNRTVPGLGSQTHNHDYWNNRTEVTILDHDAAMNPAFRPDQMATTVVLVDPPELVFEGTDIVTVVTTNPAFQACDPFVSTNFLPNCSTDAEGPPVAHPSAPSLRMQYQHAATTTWKDAGTMEWEKPIVIKVEDPRETDMPHSVWSLWRFRFIAEGPLASTLTFHVKADIHRGSNVPTWPGHPDFYAERHERIVYDGEGSYTDAGVGSYAGMQDEGKAPDMRPVSWGTRTVRVTASSLTFDSQIPITSWYLLWHNASGVWQGTLQNGTFPAGNQSYVWVLSVDDNGMDTPYTDASRWGFIVQGLQSIVTPEPVGNSISFRGFAPYSVKYHLNAVASDIPVEEATM